MASARSRIEFGHGLAHANARDLRDDVVQAFDVLNVERGVDVDAVAQQLLDVHVALGMAASRDIGVGEFIDQSKLRSAREQSVEIHFLELTPFVFEAMARHDLEALNKRLGLGASMGLNHACDDIVAVLQSGACLLQHLIGFADARRRTEENLQLADASLLFASPWQAGRPAKGAGQAHAAGRPWGIESLRGI